MRHSFFLVIPKQRNDPQRLKEFDEKILEQWVSELPIANPLLASRLVYDYITELNGIKTPVQLRLDTLEKLRPSFLAIEEYLRSRLVKTDFPKEESEKKAFRFLVALEKEFTLSYWIALKELNSHSVSWFQGKNISLSIHRCLKGLSQIIKSHFIMGMAIPDWIWLDLHSLYKLSLKLKKQTAQIALNDAVNPTSKTSSPEGCYIETLLLMLADTKGLMQREIKWVNSFIQTLSPHVVFKNHPILGQQTQCIVLLDEDKPPFFQLSDDIQSESIRLFIDFTTLYQIIDAKKASVNVPESRYTASNLVGNANEKLTVELLDYLKKRWSGIPLESTPLFGDRLDRYIAIGLTATYKLQKALDIAEEDDLEYIAQSVSNRLLSCIFKKQGILSVGSLVSFRKAGTPANKRSLGIVDKLVVEKENGKVSFGLSLLTPHALAVNYFQLNTGANEAFKKALFYQVKDQESKSYLITDTFFLKTGDMIRLFIEHEEFNITLKNKKNIGLGYWRFECMKTPEKKIIDSA
ncbi:hypothetical protein [Methylovulum miyakonense]|uniref:hypothetical protein n=1 Tax=Methylovulum miyakonense TaxID=645578 RepID=UPI00037060BD|nr:hypothetical protein [Methylovulum miyakonense]